MNEISKKTLELMNKINIGSRVLYENQWYIVDSIKPCKWQEEDPEDYICDYCIGYIYLKDKNGNRVFTDLDGCYFNDSQILFDDVIVNEFLTENDMKI
jgi:hypothetical protein